MTSSQPKPSAFLGAKGFFIQNSSLSSKSLLKVVESTQASKLKPVGLRSISPKPLFIPYLPNVSTFQAETSQNRSVAQESESRSLKRTILPSIQTSKDNRSDQVSINFTSRQSVNPAVNTDMSQESLDNMLSPQLRAHRMRESASLSQFPNPPTSKSFVQRNKSVKSESIPNSRSDLDPGNPKVCNLSPIYYNLPSQARLRLPLLIIHFEGIMGSCSIPVKDTNRENKGEGNRKNQHNDPFFIRRGLKDEFKILSKSFLIAVVFPCLSERYKLLSRHLINNKFYIDGAYYKASAPSRMDAKSVSGFILDYNAILYDFKVHHYQRKVILLLPLNLGTTIIKRDLLLKPNDSQERGCSPLYDISSFSQFFPRVQVNPTNLRIMCLPHFLLEDRNEQFSVMRWINFSAVSKLILQLLKEFETGRGLEGNSTILANPPPIELIEGEESQQNDLVEPKGTARGNLKTEGDARPIKNKESIEFLDLSSLVEELEKIYQLNTRLRRLEVIKERNRIKKDLTTFKFDLSNSRMQLIEYLAEAQKLRRALQINTKESENVLIVGLVGDLFTTNEYLFKLYEKHKFYSQSETRTIETVTRFLQESIDIHKGGKKELMENIEMIKPQQEEEMKDEVVLPEIERHCLTEKNGMKQVSRPKKNATMSREINSLLVGKRAKVVEEECEMMALMFIKDLAKNMEVYFES